MRIFLLEGEKSINKFQRPKIRAEFSFLSPSQHGGAHGPSGGSFAGDAHSGRGSSPSLLPARDNCISPVLPNLPMSEGFPWGKPWEALLALVPTAPWEGCLLHRKRGNFHLLRAQRGSGPTYNRYMGTLCPHIQ